jgi:hypothetical protein
MAEAKEAEEHRWKMAAARVAAARARARAAIVEVLMEASNVEVPGQNSSVERRAYFEPHKCLR